MSELVLEPGQFALPEAIQPVDAPVQDATDEEKATMLPTPTGWKILCAVPDVSAKIDGTELDLVKATSTLRQEEHATTVLFVLKVGPDAYILDFDPADVSAAAAFSAALSMFEPKRF